MSVLYTVNANGCSSPATQRRPECSGSHLWQCSCAPCEQSRRALIDRVPRRLSSGETFPATSRQAISASEFAELHATSLGGSRGGIFSGAS